MCTRNGNQKQKLQLISCPKFTFNEPFPCLHDRLAGKKVLLWALERADSLVMEIKIFNFLDLHDRAVISIEAS